MRAAGSQAGTSQMYAQSGGQGDYQMYVKDYAGDYQEYAGQGGSGGG